MLSLALIIEFPTFTNHKISITLLIFRILWTDLRQSKCKINQTGRNKTYSCHSNLRFTVKNKRLTHREENQPFVVEEEKTEVFGLVDTFLDSACTVGILGHNDVYTTVCR